MTSVVITGGHHNSALVVAQDLVKNGVKVLWYGQTRASRGDVNDSAEFLEVKASNIPFYPLHAGKIDSTPSFSEIANIPLGIIRALRLLRAHRPLAVISFGGYLGATTALSALLLRIPIYLHEQTTVMGKANQLTSRFARRVFLTWPNTLHAPSGSTVVGLPLRPGIFSPKHQKIFANSLPTILIMGGKRGSHAINQTVLSNLNTLLTHYNLVHQTGTNSVTADYSSALSAKSTLNPLLASRYLPIGYIGENELKTYLVSADLYVGRSGAHICYELLVTSLPALLIPFAHTTGSEQIKQAKYLASLSRAQLLPQSQLSGPNLLKAIKLALTLPKLPPAPVPLDASAKIVNQILSDLNPSS